MNRLAELFYEIGEPYAAGLFEEPERSIFYRHTLAHARYLAAMKPCAWEKGELLYPCGTKYFDTGCAVKPQFALTYQIDWDALRRKSEEGARAMEGFWEISHNPGGWTHAAPNYRRILREGLDSYRARLEAKEPGDFRDSLLILLDAMKDWCVRSAAYLREAGAPGRLADAVERVPFRPAENAYEGLAAWNLIFYFDGADNLGCLDEGMAPYEDGEDYSDLIAQLFYNIDAVGTWSCTIGPDYNSFTEQALRAIRGRRRPMLELRVVPGMPDKLWRLSLENIRAGGTNPSFYNDRAIRDMLKDRFSHIPDGELKLFCGCGCTETNLEGLTRAGGTDDNIPLALIFEEYLHAHLTECSTFEEFFEGLCRETEARIEAQLDAIAERYLYMSEHLPNPMRTLFMDDCIDKGLDFNAGGARYTWTQSSDSGLVNVIDSLAAVRELVYEKKLYEPADFLRKLTEEDPALYALLRTCPCFGTDDDRADLLGRDYASRVYAVYRNKKPKYFIDAFILTEHQFLRYEGEGLRVGATPDGRHRGDPTCDSIAALRGKASEGPTAMLKSAAKLPQNQADGISVLNLTVQKSFSDESLRALVEGYFAMGGIQVQVTCTSEEELKDAMEHPDLHRDMIVRVGGYSEYWGNLTPALRKAVFERDVHRAGE